KTYGYLCAIENDLEHIGTRLTYYQIETGEVRELRQTFSMATLKRFFQDLVNRYLKWAEAISKLNRTRDESILCLEFPFKTYRSGQRRMAEGVYRAIKNNRQLIIQAATGIGKTIGVIFPATKAMVDGFTEKIFYLTARSTGKAAAETALGALRKKGLKIKSITLTAKDKICFRPQSACSGNECEYAKGFYDRLGSGLEEIFQQDDFTRGAVERNAMKYRLCPFEYSLELALWTDCIICDYNYAFDPRVSLKRFFQVQTNRYTFMIDEAHNLVERSRAMYSSEIRKQALLDTRRLLRHDLPTVYKNMTRVNSWLIKARKKCQAAGNVLVEKEAPDDLYPLLRNFLFSAGKWLGLNVKTDYRQGLLELYHEMMGFLRIAAGYNESYTTCLETVKNDLRLKLFCIDPSGHLKEAMKRSKASLFFSATMTPLNYFHKIFGCSETVQQIVIPSPFPSDNFCLLISESISTLYRDRHRTKDDVVADILAMVKQKQGNYLLFFPSYQYMAMIHSLFLSMQPEVKTIIQASGMGKRERDDFLAMFVHGNHKTLVGFAVMGGVFGEGIDLIGDRLSGVVIVGVGLPGISPEREIIRKYFEKQNRSGFEYAYLYPGINRVLQSAGRLIRSENDRGIALLVDQRFSTFPYRNLLHREWNPIRIKEPGQIATAVKRFWGVR
ncbi:MAG: ATP-dependent DNA helicase, partial [Desulfobacterales bacterium]|nr:ATP-dependent DNA helicase [Desulfobacterales bacterium]